MHTDRNIAEPNYNSIEPEMELPADHNNNEQIAEAETKHDHHTSAIYAASHLHSAVNHVKPHHNNRLDF